MIRISRKNECSSRLDVGGREKHDKVYTGSSLVELEEGRESGLENKGPDVFQGMTSLNQLFY